MHPSHVSMPIFRIFAVLIISSWFTFLSFFSTLEGSNLTSVTGMGPSHIWNTRGIHREGEPATVRPPSWGCSGLGRTALKSILEIKLSHLCFSGQMYFFKVTTMWCSIVLSCKFTFVELHTDTYSSNSPYEYQKPTLPKFRDTGPLRRRSQGPVGQPGAELLNLQPAVASSFYPYRY